MGGGAAALITRDLRMMSRYLLWLLRTEEVAASGWEGRGASPAPAMMCCEAAVTESGNPGSSPCGPSPPTSTALWRGCLLLNAASAWRREGRVWAIRHGEVTEHD